MFKYFFGSCIIHTKDVDEDQEEAKEKIPLGWEYWEVSQDRDSTI